MRPAAPIATRLEDYIRHHAPRGCYHCPPMTDTTALQVPKLTPAAVEVVSTVGVELQKRGLIKAATTGTHGRGKGATLRPSTSRTSNGSYGSIMGSGPWQRSRNHLSLLTPISCLLRPLSIVAGRAHKPRSTSTKTPASPRPCCAITHRGHG